MSLACPWLACHDWRHSSCPCALMHNARLASHGTHNTTAGDRGSTCRRALARQARRGIGVGERRMLPAGRLGSLGRGDRANQRTSDRVKCQEPGVWCSETATTRRNAMCFFVSFRELIFIPGVFCPHPDTSIRPCDGANALCLCLTLTYLCLCPDTPSRHSIQRKTTTTTTSMSMTSEKPPTSSLS